MTCRPGAMAERDPIGNTPTMTTSPPPTRYHRWLGWYAPAMRRAVVVSSIGLTVVVVLVWFVPWRMAVVAGWDAAARVLLIGVAVLTVVLSWTVVNTVYTLRYADLHFSSGEAGIAFGDPDGQEQPTYRDFAYVAFTIGMCYQVSDTTVRDPWIRGTVLSHAFLSYLFGVVIVAGSVNLIAGLLY
jgi:uncharacterized membrane protein